MSKKSLGRPEFDTVNGNRPGADGLVVQDVNVEALRSDRPAYTEGRTEDNSSGITFFGQPLSANPLKALPQVPPTQEQLEHAARVAEARKIWPVDAGEFNEAAGLHLLDEQSKKLEAAGFLFSNISFLPDFGSADLTPTHLRGNKEQKPDVPDPDILIP